MITKLLIEKYFENKVRTIPYGAEHFFQAIDEITGLLEIPGLINLEECDLCKLFSDCDNIVITLDTSRIGPIISPIFPSAAPSPFKTLPNKVLLNITGGPDMTIYEVNDIAENVYNAVDPQADIIFGAMVDDNMCGTFKTTVIMGN